MPRFPRAVPPVLAGLLLLTACGSHDGPPGAGGDGRVRAQALCPSDYTQYGATPSPRRPTATASGTPTSLPLPSPAPEENGVRITKLYAWGPGSGCAGVEYSAEFEVANTTDAAATYTVTLAFSSSSGGAAGTADHVVEAVGPGRTGKGAAAMHTTQLGDAEVTGVKVLKVRSVPVAEASSASGPCPKAGVRVYADRGTRPWGCGSWACTWSTAGPGRTSSTAIRAWSSRTRSTPGWTASRSCGGPRGSAAGSVGRTPRSR